MSDSIGNICCVPEDAPGKAPELRLLTAALTAFIAGYMLFPMLINLFSGSKKEFFDVLPATGPLLSVLMLFGLVRMYCGSWRGVRDELDLKIFPRRMLLWGFPVAAGIMLLTAMVTVAWGLIAAVIGLELGTPPTVEAAMSGNVWRVAALLITALVAAPLFEEIFFRRALFKTLDYYCGNLAALLVTGFIFGSVHFSLLQLPGLMVMSIIWQQLYSRSQTLYTTVILHLFNNLIAAGLLISARCWGWIE